MYLLYLDSRLALEVAAADPPEELLVQRRMSWRQIAKTLKDY